MTTNNIDKSQQSAFKNDRLDSFARYLIHCDPVKQKQMLKVCRSDALRDDLRERMKQQLAIEIAAMPCNIKDLRLSRLLQRCQNRAFSPDFYHDILGRVNALLIRAKDDAGR